MGLPDSYTLKPGAIRDYFDAILNAQAPDRFSQRFLEKLGFRSTNDRLFIGILKELGFIDTDGVPTERYYRFHDKSQWQQVVAEGILDAYSDLYAVNQSAHDLLVDDVTNKLRTLYEGKKTDHVISRIARTFTALCEVADFSGPAESHAGNNSPESLPEGAVHGSGDATVPPTADLAQHRSGSARPLALDSLQYHINIVLPESRDQAVFDAIFKSLKNHLGR